MSVTERYRVRDHVEYVCLVSPDRRGMTSVISQCRSHQTNDVNMHMCKDYSQFNISGHIIVEFGNGTLLKPDIKGRGGGVRLVVALVKT